ncbi:hypothetical protein ACTMTF_49375, partial [Nonomuraea sp. ZG12]
MDWAAVLPMGERVALPTYAFQRQRYWPKPVPAPRRSDDDVTTAEESAFWAAVTGGDLDGLAQTLAVDGERLREVLPALASWRQRERGESAVADWRYRITWTPLTEPAPATLSGTWLLVAPTGQTGTDQATVSAQPALTSPGVQAASASSGVEAALTASAVQALTDRGARVLVIEVAPGELDRQSLRVQTTQILGELGDLPVAGIVSLLAVDESPLDESPVVPSGLAGTMGLVQALGDAGIDAPLWALTSGAVAAGGVPVGSAQAQTWAFGRVAALEHPDRWGGLIDLPPVWDARTADR